MMKGKKRSVAIMESLSLVAAASAPPSSMSKRRSPRKHRRLGESEAEAETRLAVETAATTSPQEVDHENGAAVLTHTPRQPLFSKLLAPHQQHSMFSPGALRTPLKQQQSASKQHQQSKRQSLTPSILRKMTPIQARAEAAAAASVTTTMGVEGALNDRTNEQPMDQIQQAPQQQQLLDPIVNNLAKTMEEANVPSVNNAAMESAPATFCMAPSPSNYGTSNSFPAASGEDAAATATTNLEPAVSDTPTTIQPDALQYRLSLLYSEQKYPHIQCKPCILPRIIAAYTLHKDLQEEESQHPPQPPHALEYVSSSEAHSKKITRRRKRSMDSKTHAIQQIQPIRIFLDALVDLEWNLLEESSCEASPSHQTDLSSDGNKRVHFAAFDGSALCPPIDVLEGSQQQQESCIFNLETVLDTIKGMDTTTGSRELAVLRDFVSYLDNDFRLYYHDKTCARSISKLSSFGALSSSSSANRVWYPTRRVEKAAETYSRDLDSLIEILSTASSSTITNQMADGRNINWGPPINRPLLSWECRMADVSAQLVRYWLRTLLNPVPCRAVAKDKTDKWISRIFEMVTLINNTDSEFLGESSPADSDDESATSSAAVEDGCLSSLLTDALSHIYDYLGGVPELVTGAGDTWRKQLQLVIPSEACLSSEVCIRGIGNARKPTPFLTDLEWKHVGDELQVAADFAAFFHRVLFLEQLVTILMDAGESATHWESTVQASAQRLICLQKSLSGNPVKLQPSLESTVDLLESEPSHILQQEDAHLVLLGLSLAELQSRIHDVLPLASERYHVIKLHIQRSVAVFRFGKSNTKHKKQYQPEVGELEEYWEELLEGIVFPSVASLFKNEDDAQQAA